MTIQEAILSGKRFRRQAWGTKSYWSINPFDGGLPWKSARWEVGDILATDWEIEGEQKQVTITSSDFFRARNAVRLKVPTSRDTDMYISEYVDALKKELGL